MLIIIDIFIAQLVYKVLYYSLIGPM